MEEHEKIELHYQMLEYLFQKCKLATSCFNHTWELFLRENPEYQNLLTESELKIIFWTEIAPNVEQYELLTEEQAEYFHHDGSILNLSDENLGQTLQNNEPQKGSDYAYLKSTENIQPGSRLRLGYKNIQKIFNEPNKVGNADNQIILNIVEKKDLFDLDNMFYMKMLEPLFQTETDNQGSIDTLTEDEISNRLGNADICTQPEHLGMFSNNLMKTIQGTIKKRSSTLDAQQVSQELPSFEFTQSAESLNSSKSLSILVPEISRTPTRLMTRSLSQTTPSSMSRRSALQYSTSKIVSSSRVMSSKKALVPEPALNLKMSKFMEKHGKRKK